MANEQNLVPLTTEKAREIGKKGGIASGKAKKAKKSREERIEFIFNLAVKNPSVIKKMKSMGIDVTEMDNETAMDCQMVLEALAGNVNAWNSLKNERYGMKTQKVEQTNIEPPKPLSPRKQKTEQNEAKGGK